VTERRCSVKTLNIAHKQTADVSILSSLSTTRHELYNAHGKYPHLFNPVIQKYKEL